MNNEDLYDLIKKHPSLERLPNEPTPSWRKRCCYCRAGSKRSPSYVVEHEMKIPKPTPSDVGESRKEYNKAIKSVSKLIERWNYDMYAHLYDIEEQTIKVQKREEKFNELEDIELNMLEVLIKSLHNFIGEFVKNPLKQNGERYSLMSQSDLYIKILNAFDKADIILRRLTGQPLEYKKIDNNSVIDVKAFIKDEETEEEKMKKYVDYIKQIDTEPNSDIRE